MSIVRGGGGAARQEAWIARPAQRRPQTGGATELTHLLFRHREAGRGSPTCYLEL